MPVVSIRHLTTYRYRKPVSFGEHRMMFRPMESHDQRLISAEVSISPTPELLRHVHDVSGATVGVARFSGRADELAFESRARLDHRPTAAFELEGEAALVPGEAFVYASDELAELSRAIQRRHADPEGEVAAWAQRFVRPAGRTPALQALSDMTHAIRSDFAYGIRLQGAPQTPLETLETRRGSCRDFAVLMMEGARSLGLAARFASGYVYSASPKSGRKGGGHTHAWARVYLPDSGWTDFDPTNGIIGNTDLVRVTAVVDPRQALPLHGTWAGEAGDYLGMEVEVDISLEAASLAQPAPHLRVAQTG